MGDREFTEFETTVAKSNRILNELEEEMGWQNRRSQTYAAMREVLHALRDRLVFSEAIQFAEQLPMLLAGVYIDGWKPAKTPMKMDKEEFYNRIQAHLPYKIDGGADRLVKAVWKVLQKNISKGELDDIRASMPKDLSAALG
jgi:uncharacterized protein (DUF2267 family)